MKISKMTGLFFSIFLLLSLAGCQDISVSSVQDNAGAIQDKTTVSVKDNTAASGIGAATAVPRNAQVKTAETDETAQDFSKLFELKLHSDKAAYSTTDKIKLWATLKYTGSNSHITIWHGTPYISFYISDGKDFNIGGIAFDDLTSTDLNKDELYRFDYIKNGAYTADDPKVDFWKRFYSEEDLYLPEGEYTVKVCTDFKLTKGAQKNRPYLSDEFKIMVNSGPMNDTAKTADASLSSIETSGANNGTVDPDSTKLNRANDSFVVTDGTWVYFPNWKDGQSLYRQKPDGSESVKLNDEETTWLNLKGGWIYYACFNAGPTTSDQGIYKIKTDGTNRTKLSGDHAMNLMLEGDWLYFKEYDPMGKGEMYRMKPDGSGRQKLNDIDSWHAVISDGWIYYSGNMSKFFKMKLDGSENTILSKSAAQQINIAGDWIYFSTPYSRGQIYKCRRDGTERTKIGTARTDYGMLVLQDWIYYINNSDKKLYKVRTDGTDNTKVISDGLLYNINYLDGWLYYREMESPYLLYQSRLDGTGRRAVE